MEYLEYIGDKLNTINEENIVYYDIFNYPEFVYGNINLASHNLNFSKLPKLLCQNITNEEDQKHAKNLSHSSYGSRLRFRTKAEKIILKIELKQDFRYDDIPLENSRGFDVYNLDYDRYIHKCTLFAEDKKNCFAESIEFEESDNDICIFLPNFDTVKHLYIGLEKGFCLDELPYLGQNKLPIIFCGNEYTIGKTASRSGNSYPNIVSQTLDQNIINLSYYHMNKADEYLATIIGKFNCECIVIDYNGKNIDKKEYKKSLENFYNKLRIFHPNKQIIILTSILDKTDEYNSIIYEFVSKVNDDNLKLIDKKELLKTSNIKDNPFNQKSDEELLQSIAQRICTLMKKY